MTDITELAQGHELLIANGQQTADLLRHLADNEIDSDYFAVVSECESYGKETDAELSITEFALSAAGYVDTLVEALEKAQRANAAQDDHINQQQDRIESLEKKNAELGKYAGGLESFRTAYMEWSDKTDWVQKDKRFDVLKPWGKHRADVLKEYIQHLESRTVMLERQLVGRVDEKSLTTINPALTLDLLPKNAESLTGNSPVNDVTAGKPFTILLPDISSKAFWSGAGKNETFHPETYRRWVKEAIERYCAIARIDVEVK